MEMKKREQSSFSSLRKKTVAFSLSLLLVLTSVLSTGFFSPVNVQASTNSSIKFDPKPNYDDYPEIDHPPVFSSYQEAVNYIGKMNAHCIKYKKSSYNGFISYYDPDFQYSSEYFHKFTDDTHLATCKKLGDPHGQHLGEHYPTGISIMGVYSYNENTHIVETSVGIPAAFSPEEDAMERELYEAADLLLESLNLEGLSDYEKAYRIYRWVSNNVKYKLGAPHNQTAYGALIDRECVCAGYADLIYVLFNKVGIDTHLDWNREHEWNVVKMDGQYYYCDPTNDKANTVYEGRSYLHFLMGINSKAMTIVAGNGDDIEGRDMPTGQWYAESSKTGSHEKFHIAQKDYAGNTTPAVTPCKNGHDLELVKTLPANCKHAERKVYNCSVCGSEYKVEEDTAGTKGEHDYTLIETTGEDDCTKPVENIYFCELCEHQKTETVRPAGEHTWDAGQVTTAPTCETEGERTYTCTACPKTRTEVIPANGHTEVTDPAVEPTCQSPGKTEGIHCSVCGKVIKAQKEIPVSDKHSWDKVTVKKPTCTERGEAKWTCRVCGKTEMKGLNKIPHNPVPADDFNKEATCDQSGWEGRTKCSECGRTLSYGTEIPALGHAWDEGTVTKEPTCAEEGVKTYTCATCKKTKTEPIAKEAHTEVIDEAVAPTCQTEGKTEGIHCSVCKAVIKAQEVIPKLNHNWDAGKVTKEPTCTKEGEKTYTCQDCPATKTEPIEKKPHTEVIDEAVAPTCQTEGTTEGSHCSVCGTVIKKQEVVQKLAHNWDAGKTTKEPTCNTNGIKTYTCVSCHTTKTESIAKLGHVWDSGVITKAPTYETEGIKTYTCRNCKATRTESIAKLLRPVTRVQKINLSGMSNKIAIKKKLKLTADVLPVNAANKSLVWTTSNKKVATVNQSGVVTIKKKGSAVITATAENGVKASFKENGVKGVVKKVSVISKTKTVKAGKSLTLKAKVSATKGANKKLLWSSSNENYATVSPKGKVKTLAAGKGKKVKITAMATDGSGKKRTVTIKIK